MVLIIILVLLVVFLSASLKVVNQYERGVLFTLGKYTRIMSPGLRMVIPVIQSWQRVDIRTKAVDVPDQEAMTKDNIAAKINAVIYYKITHAEKAVIEVEDFYYAISQLAQTTMRNIVGEVELDELLSNREFVAKKIREIIDKATDPWGILVEGVELKDVILPAEMKRIIGKQAEAEREKRSVIIKAEGEVTAATNMAKAASVLSKNEGALHLRTLQALNNLASDQSNTVIFALPVEVLRALEGFGKNNKK